MFGRHPDEKVGVFEDPRVRQVVVAEQDQDIEVRGCDLGSDRAVHLVDLGLGVLGGCRIEPRQARGVTCSHRKNDVSHEPSLPDR